MAKKSTKEPTEAAPERDLTSTVNFRFPTDGKVQPEGFEDLTLTDNVVVILRGRVTSVAEYDEEWDKAKSFSVEVTACEISIPGNKKGVSLDEAIEAGKQTV